MSEPGRWDSFSSRSLPHGCKQSKTRLQGRIPTEANCESPLDSYVVSPTSKGTHEDLSKRYLAQLMSPPLPPWPGPVCGPGLWHRIGTEVGTDRSPFTNTAGVGVPVDFLLGPSKWKMEENAMKQSHDSGTIAVERDHDEPYFLPRSGGCCWR